MGGQLEALLASGLTIGMSPVDCGPAAAAAALAPSNVNARSESRMAFLPEGRGIADRARSVQTVKLSPQPQAPLALGLSNTKPAAKSSSRQSMTEPTR